MNLDELQSTQARERQSSDLQHLRSSFYSEVGEFIETLDQKRARVVESADDPFSEPEVRRLTNDIETAESTVEAIYERRVGKIVKKASIAAAGMPVEENGLTSEEQALFDDLVDRIEGNRDTVLSVLDGDSPTVSCSIDEASENGAGADHTSETEAPTAGEPSATEDLTAGPDENSESGGVSAADLMGGKKAPPADSTGQSADQERPAPDPDPGDPDGAENSPSGQDPGESDLSPPESPPGVEADSPTPPTPEPTTENADSTRNVRSAGEQTAVQETPEEPREIPGVPRTTVKITANVGEIVGADDRDYDLGAEDVVTLPEPNADVLVEKNAAERL
jgi:DNA replication factor GINS